jgi:hypothetical protein
VTDAPWAFPEELPATDPAAGTAPVTGAADPPVAPAHIGHARVPTLPVFERALTVADVLDGAFQVIKARPRVIIGISAMFVLPVGILVAIADFGALGGDIVATLTDPDTFEQGNSTGGADIGFTIVAGLVTSAMVTLMAPPIARVVEAWYLGRELTAWAAVRSLGWSWLSVLVAFVAVHVIEALGSVALVLPGLAAMALLLPVAPVIALERIGPFAAIKRSISLSKRRFWSILWIALLSGLVATTLSLMLPLLPLAIVSVVGFGGEQYVVGAATIAASLLVLPFVAGAAVMAYFDLRVRTEGLDIQSSIGQHFEAHR